MDSMNQTPSKKRRLDPAAYDSHDDSGDEIFNTFETVETVPLPDRPSTQSVTVQSQLWTQPTQVDGRAPINAGDSHRRSTSIVQVAASSPLQQGSVASPSAIPMKSKNPSIGSLLAPAGTTFRPPNGAARNSSNSQPTVICISDDDDDDDNAPVYCGDSSDENTQSKSADIKPSSFVAHAHHADQTTGVKRFKDMISTSVYHQPPLNHNPGRPSPLPSSDILATAYGGGRSKVASPNNRPDSAMTLSRKIVGPACDITLTDIQDYQMRDKIKKIRGIVPERSILECRDALLTKQNNYNDALGLLLDSEEIQVDSKPALGFHENLPSSGEKRPAAKQQIRAPVQKIHEKWTATQHPKKPSQVDELVSIKTTPPQGSRRRLVQGQKKPLPDPPSTVSHEAQSAPSESDKTDSGFGEDSSGDESDLAANLLGFFNKSSASDVMDIAAIPEQTAKFLISQRPFSSLDAVRQISISEALGQSHRVRKGRAMGDKIVDKCLEMWEAYQAIDQLVRECEELSKPLKDAMCKWGIDIHSSVNENGELEVVDILGAKDSGIGTPTSRGASAEDDNEGSQKVGSSRAHKEVFLGQPSNMGKGVLLKGYQVVGMNWLSLLYHQGVSCILADDMGLGKTCQVIAFLAHLLQKGIKGPHLIIGESTSFQIIKHSKACCNGQPAALQGVV